ncbi:MAG: hypothetical protein H6585_04905 [Flavobacteriales bacterium]|nr:hypothetical protein [Flavobacteriales bacterium]MCB9447667.1 hypothetical protein [Flavobacteriales bacterium]
MPRTIRSLALGSLLCLICFSGHAQDSTAAKQPEPFHSPNKAAIMSAVLPGLGQAYNRKYWKIPIVYGAFGGLTYFALYNNSKYRLYRDEYVARINEDSVNIDPALSWIPTDNLRSAQSTFRRYRDFDFILMGVVYTLNIVDAVVDAHLYYFDVSDDLSLEWHPSLLPVHSSYHRAPGLTLTLRL